MAATPTKENKQEAIAFAIAEFHKGARFWPRLLVKFAECCCDGSALNFTIRLYVSVVRESGRDLLLDWLLELRAAISNSVVPNPRLLRERSRTIWEDNRDRSVEKRGITRLFDALASRFENSESDYQIAVTRALSLFVDDTPKDGNSSRFDRVIRDFDAEF